MTTLSERAEQSAEFTTNRSTERNKPVKRKVLHLMWSGAIGGAERAVFQLVRAQREDGVFEPAIAYGQARGHYAEQFRKEGIPVIDLGLRGATDFRKFAAVRRALSGFDIHHFHAAELMLMMASASCGEHFRVYTHRGGASHYPFKKTFLYRCAGAIMRRKFHAFSGNTGRACEVAPRVLRLPGAKWSVTYNGIDFSLLSPKVPREEMARRVGLDLKAGPIIGTSANLRAWKRIDLLLEACAHHATDFYRLLIVGDGPDRERLENLTDQLNLRAKVLFTGRTDHVADYLNLMDIFVLPSNSEESFGNSVVEAMVLGLPSIVFEDGGGLPEHIENGKTGFIVSSVLELGKRMNDLLRSPELRARIGPAAANSMRERYTLKAMLQRYNSLYCDALSKAAPGPVAGT